MDLVKVTDIGQSSTVGTKTIPVLIDESIILGLWSWIRQISEGMEEGSESTFCILGRILDQRVYLSH